MKNFQPLNIVRIIKFDLKNHTKPILIWSAIMFSFMLLYMSLFPSIKDMAEVKFDLMPVELMQFFNIQDLSSMDNYISFFGMIFNLLLIAISIFSATFAASLVQKEEKNKTIEFLNALHVSRNEIYFAKYIVLMISTVFILFCALACSFVLGFIVGGDTFNVTNFLSITNVSSLSPFFFGTLSFFLCAITTKIPVGSVSSGIVFASYMLGFLSKLLSENGEMLKYFSPLDMFSPDNAIAFENITAVSFFVYICLTIVLFVVGIPIYKKRDLNI